MRALLLLLSLALAGDPSLADLDAAAARARGLSLSGPAPGQVLTRKEADVLLMTQFKARARGVQEVHRVAGALISSGAPDVQLAALLRLAWVELEFGEALRDSYVPTYLTEDQGELYRLGLEDKVHITHDHAFAFVVQANKLVQPGSPESIELARLWLAIRYEPGPAMEHVCAPPPPPLPRRHPGRVLEDLKAVQLHLQLDLSTFESCLPPDLLQYAREVTEQTAAVIAEQDTSIAPDVKPFVDDLTSQLHEALPSACDVRDHLAVSASPAAAPAVVAPATVAPPPPVPVIAASEIHDLDELNSALELAERSPQDAPQPSCPRGPPTERAGLLLGALRSVEQSAQGLSSAASHLTLAAAYTRASRDLAVSLPASALIEASTAQLRQQQGALWAATRADAHLMAVTQDLDATEAERIRSLAELEQLTRWRWLLQATRLPEPRDLRTAEH